MRQAKSNAETSASTIAKTVSSAFCGRTSPKPTVLMCDMVKWTARRYERPTFECAQLASFHAMSSVIQLRPSADLGSV